MIDQQKTDFETGLDLLISSNKKIDQEDYRAGILADGIKASLKRVEKAERRKSGKQRKDDSKQEAVDAQHSKIGEIHSLIGESLMKIGESGVKNEKLIEAESLLSAADSKLSKLELSLPAPSQPTSRASTRASSAKPSVAQSVENEEQKQHVIEKPTDAQSLISNVSYQNGMFIFF